jgi:hypothetical protein
MKYTLANVYGAVNRYEQEHGESFFDQIDGICTDINIHSVSFMKWLLNRPYDYNIVVDFMKKFYDDSYRLDNDNEFGSEQEFLNCLTTVGVDLLSFLWEGMLCKTYQPSYLVKYDFLRPSISHYDDGFNLLYCFLFEFLIEENHEDIIDEWFDFIND